jgi:7,8-dihydropterin-6-yl-methyl-4-(beta-D-ribofuranosyl)aminobenzene 5'-phosphate synthase
MKTAKITALLLLLLLPEVTLCAQEYAFLRDPEGLEGISPSSGITEPVTVRVVYDNYVHTSGMTADWGYSIMIGGLEKTLLFDTGTRPEIFESNFRKMNLDATETDAVLLSHEHQDHIGGISAFIKMKSGIPVIMPAAFPEEFKLRMAGLGMEPVMVKEPAMICTHLYTSGVFDYPLAEQALVLDTKKGLVVMTGCSHPGIVNMLEVIKSSFNKNIYMVFGGFHLMNESDRETASIISRMKALGVVKCGATHCTGDKQIEIFRKTFGSDFVELGVGNTIIINP